MNITVTVDEKSATSFEETAGRPRGQVWPKAWFSALIRDLWPVKGAVAVEQYAGVPDRTARNYQSGHSDPSGTVVCNLLRGDEGFRVLKWIMGGSTATWWLVMQHERELAAMARNIFNQLETVMK